MDIDISIGSGQINLVNNIQNSANITIDLTQVWDSLEASYSDVSIDVNLQIPTVETLVGGGTVQKITETNVIKNMKITEIIDKKVIFTVNYPGEIDTTRQPSGKAIITGFNVITVN